MAKPKVYICDWKDKSYYEKLSDYGLKVILPPEFPGYDPLPSNLEKISLIVLHHTPKNFYETLESLKEKGKEIPIIADDSLKKQIELIFKLRKIEYEKIKFIPYDKCFCDEIIKETRAFRV